jgi:hypothetical protein
MVMSFSEEFPLEVIPNLSSAMTALVATPAETETATLPSLPSTLTGGSTETSTESTADSSTESTAESSTADEQPADVPDVIPEGLLPGGRRRRNLQTETIKTDTGYVDYEIKPAIEIKIVDEDGVEKTMGDDELDINFSWAITEMTETTLVISMDFEVPESLSSDGEGKDYLQVTFHGSDLIKGQNGLPIEVGLTVTKEITRQVNKEEAEQVSGTADLCAKVLVCFTLITFVASLFMMADFTTFWSMFNTVQIIVHYPMFGMNIPGQLGLFFAQLIEVAKFNIFGVNDSILESWTRRGGVKQIISDAHENPVFA